MKIFLILFLLSSILFGDTILKIASYNVENLFDLQRGGFRYNEYKPYGKSNWNDKTYNAKLNNIAKVIKDMDADIISLEEIGSLNALKDLRYAIKRAGVYYKYFKIADKKNTSVKVAMLSKIPFVYTNEIMVNSSMAYRNILEAKFKINGRDLYIFTNHWKAKSGAESKRIVSAKALKRRIDHLGYDKNIILLGDFNSDYEEYKKFVKTRRLNDTNGRTGINHILKSIDQTQRASIVQYKRNNFYNLWYDVPELHRYSYIFRRKGEALDNILISQELLNNQGIYYIKNSMKHFNKLYLFKGKNIYRWQATRRKPHKFTGKGYSDHLPIFAKFRVVD